MIMWFTCFSWNIILFYSLLEGFRTSLQIFHITSYGILHKVEFFKHTIFSNLFFENPHLQGRLVGRPCLVCSLLKIHLKYVHEWVVSNMRYTLDLIIVSIGIIGSFQLVSILTILLYTHIFFLYVCLQFK